MLRVLGLVSVVLAAVLGMVLYAQSARQAVSTGGTGAQAREAAAQAGADATLLVARTSLESHFAASGTYAGATLPPVPGLTLARVDTASYCVQAGAGATARHVAGPGGEPAAGPCP